MGFSGGGSNVLKSHTHDGTIVQDGGSLNMDNVTQAALTAGDIVYSDGVHLQRLAIGNVSETLTSSGAVPQWSAAASGGPMEFIATQTSTGNDFTTFTFADAIDFTDYSCMIAHFALGTDDSRTLQIQLGDTTAGGLINTNYDSCYSDNEAGTWTSSYSSGNSSFEPAHHPRLFSTQGVSGYIRVYLAYSGTAERLMMQAVIQGHDSTWLSSAYNTNTLTDLKYFRLFVGDPVLSNGSNITCYKIRRS